MKTEKIYISALQSISFKVFAIAAYILLFISHRLPILRIDEIELSNVTENFSLSNIAFGKISKFFDYFGVNSTSEITILTVFSIIILAFGVAVLAMSLFEFRNLQVINFCISAVGSVLSIIFTVMLIINSLMINSNEIGEIMVLEPRYFIMLLSPLLFIIGTVFIYAYAKMPDYTLSEGKFFITLRAALNPKFFIKTFRSYDDTEALFRTRVPLKKKKYVSLSEPAALKKIKKHSKKHNKNNDSNIKLNKKLSPLELALSKREHAETIANTTADEFNRALSSKKQNLSCVKKIHKTTTSKNKSKTKNSKNNALEIAKLKAIHAEEVANQNNELY